MGQESHRQSHDGSDDVRDGAYGPRFTDPDLAKAGRQADERDNATDHEAQTEDEGLEELPSEERHEEANEQRQRDLGPHQ